MASKRKKTEPAVATEGQVDVRARSVTMVAVDTLKPYERNARTHSELQIGQLVGTIRKLGFSDPLLVDEHNMILSGHGRWEAAKRLGMPEVPCVRVEGMSDIEKRASILAFNRIAQNAGWDLAIMTEELSALSEHEIDVEILGFSALETFNAIGSGSWSSDIESMEKIEASDAAASGSVTLLFAEPDREQVLAAVDDLVRTLGLEGLRVK
jgi:ParB-like chromosome segregation protein Spo0J